MVKRKQLTEQLSFMFTDSVITHNKRNKMEDTKQFKHIVCYSGGHSSALVAIEVTRKFGKDNVILLNHDISANVENQDIKRFKKEVADYLGIGITYANYKNLPVKDMPDQFDVVKLAGGFKFGTGNEICTSRLKTEPFMKYLKENFNDKNCCIYYGFDANEIVRIQRRSGILGNLGYKTDYPLALWRERTIQNTSEIGILPPNTYENFKHANCVGCLKAGSQHWYIVYCTRPDIWKKAKEAEDEIGFTIIKGKSLEDLEPMFKQMSELGIEPTEHIKHQKFWSDTKKLIKISEDIEGDKKPCECVF